MRGRLSIFFFLIFLIGPPAAKAQQITSANEKVVDAFNLAVNTMDINIRRGILAAGGDYGGEWTRDIAINSWNCTSLLRPKVALKSLWSVTINKDSIGHQYWDKIIWTIAAMNHYKVTGDKVFLAEAYQCAKNTMTALERGTYDDKYGLFMGPSVFNDGIAGYPESVYDSLNNASLVLDHQNSHTIKCLSTNAVYFKAYKILTEMSAILKDGNKKVFIQKATRLRNQALKYLYNEKDSKLYYLIDNQGKIDESQEALGISFAILFGLLNKQQAAAVINQAKTSRYGIPSILPDFARYDAKRPGRHNRMIWPMVNGFFADAALTTNNPDVFTAELTNIIHLALDEDKGNYNFREIYNADSGVPDGGWQRRKTPKDIHWTSFKNQTWSATAYLRMVFNGLLGMKFEPDALYLSPFLPADIYFLTIESLPYRKAILNIRIKGKGSHISLFTVNGRKQKDFKVSATALGIQNININLE
jgi:glycogen debranching enzyme